ncbi:hypothetical protein LCGC14_2566510 [marine sediment metagenome]|uniref:Uncharacterized protein n=1 Tax=marine sediment metagenome TaxID=412755 RepID=A0A0F9AIG3_9ZZZZ
MAKKCRHKKLALVAAYIEELIPDQEPYKSGELEGMDNIIIGIRLFGHWCPKCEYLVDIEVDEDY